MDGQPKQSHVKLMQGAWWWLGILALAMLAVWPLGRFDDVTELAPDHTDVLEYCFGFAGVVAIISAFICFFRSSGPLLSRLLMAVFCFALLGGLSTFLVTSTIANIVEN